MKGAVFPWRAGNRYELLIDGPQFFPRMLAAIANAREQVELELYLMSRARGMPIEAPAVRP